MKKTIFFILLFFSFSAAAQKYTLYLLPGLGADARVFQNLNLPDSIQSIPIMYPIPNKKESMAAFAARLVNQIDTTQSFSLLGVSLGGMLSIELGKILEPEHIFLVASAKTRSDLPFRYRFQTLIPLYKVFGGGFMKRTGVLGARIFEPAMRPHLSLFKSMLQGKDKRFLNRALSCIVHWKNTEIPPNVLHLHGTKDHTLPVRAISDAQIVEGASHWLVFLEAGVVRTAILARIGQ